MKYKRFYINKEDLIQNKLLTGDEFFHATKVLRIKEQDTICFFCNDEYDYIADVTCITKNGISYNVVSKNKNVCNPKKEITLIQALAKNDKLDLITQKATELGVSEIIPFYSTYCDVKQNSTKVDRLEKIAINACKQCGRSIIPKITETEKLLNINFNAFDLIIFANECEKTKSLKELINKNQKAEKITIIIGPEGGFSEQEINTLIENGAQSTTLGNRILRTETAGLYILSYLAETLGV